jgi:hypothetical protein
MEARLLRTDSLRSLPGVQRAREHRTIPWRTPWTRRGLLILGAAIETIRGKRIHSRVLKIATVRSLGESSACNILFVPPAELSRYSRDPGLSTPRPLLTIADLTEDGAGSQERRNVLVALVREQRRIGFEIDLQAVRRRGLRMSSELLKLARIVDGQG